MAIETGTADQFVSLFKTRYENTGQAEQILRFKSPFFAKVKRKPDQYGLTIHIPIKYAEQRGHAKGVAGMALLANTTHSPVGPPKYSHFLISLEREYGRADFDLVTLKQMSSTEGAFFDLYDSRMKGMLGRFRDSVSHALFRDGTGIIGTVASASITAGSGTITFANKMDAAYIGQGDTINMINPGSPATPVGGDYTTSYFLVTARNIQAGTISVTRQGTTAVDSVTTGWLVSKLGDYVQNGVGRIRGLGAICPLTAPTAGDSFYGTDRSIDVNTMAGWRFDGPPTTKLEHQINEMASYMNDTGVGRQLWSFANPEDVRLMLARANGTISLSEETLGKGEYKYGLKYATVVTAAGDVRVYPDPYCPRGRWFGLNDEAVELGLLGEEPEIITVQGQNQIRLPGQDSFSVEARLLAQVYPTSPRDIVTGTLA